MCYEEDMSTSMIGHLSGVLRLLHFHCCALVHAAPGADKTLLICAQKRIAEEIKLRKKQKKKEREERAKQEGRYLTDRQKLEKKRAEQMLRSIQELGMSTHLSLFPPVVPVARCQCKCVHVFLV